MPITTIGKNCKNNNKTRPLMKSRRKLLTCVFISLFAKDRKNIKNTIDSHLTLEVSFLTILDNRSIIYQYNTLLNLTLTLTLIVQATINYRMGPNHPRTIWFRAVRNGSIFCTYNGTIIRNFEIPIIFVPIGRWYFLVDFTDNGRTIHGF
jgi:hypothetical protein